MHAYNVEAGDTCAWKKIYNVIRYRVSCLSLNIKASPVYHGDDRTLGLAGCMLHETAHDQ